MCIDVEQNDFERILNDISPQILSYISILSGLPQYDSRPQMKDGRSKQQQTRTRIAVAAARIMAEDGVDTFSSAKRKAARQLGIQNARILPADDEIEIELRTYQALYQGKEHASHIHRLRTIALEVMRMLDRFHPHLTGAVLKGTAGRFNGIDLQLFSDDPKAIELFLLNLDIPYDISDRRHAVSDQTGAQPVLTMEWRNVPVTLAIHNSLRDEGSKLSPSGYRIERADIQAITDLLSSK